MSKKILMHMAFVITIILYLGCNFLNFTLLNNKIIYLDKTEISINKPDNILNDTFINIIFEVSEELSTDIMLERVNSNLEYEYYKTNLNKNFLNLNTSKNSCIVESTEILSTNDNYGTDKIYGFTIMGNHIHIHPFYKIKEFDLSTGNYLVETKKLNAFITKLEMFGIECEIRNSIANFDTFDEFLYFVYLFSFFGIITTVYYAFSRGHEFVVKKSLGYGNINICIDELKNNIPLFLKEILSIVVVSCLIFTITFDFKSTLLFFKEVLPVIFLILVLSIAILFASVLAVATGISARKMKGYNDNKELFIVTTFFKLIISIICLLFLTKLTQNIYETNQIYLATQMSAKSTEGYAATTLNTFIEDPDNEPEKYANRIANFYKFLHDKHGLILIDAYGADEPVDNSYHLNSIFVNDNYIDVSKDIYLKDGSRLTSNILKKGMRNYLVPEGFDTRLLINKYNETEELNFVEYSSDSKFFTYSNTIAAKNYGYLSDVIVVVFDLDYEIEHESAESLGYILSGYLSNSLIFKYDVEDNLSPYEQIIDYIEEFQLDNIIISTPIVKDIFNENLNNYYYSILYDLIFLVTILIAFISLLYLASELYYLNHSKEISIKIINGYSIIKIFGRVFLSKVFIMIIFLCASYLFSINLYIGLLMVLSENAIFYIIMKRKSKLNLVSILKGE